MAGTHQAPKKTKRVADTEQKTKQTERFTGFVPLCAGICVLLVLLLAFAGLTLYVNGLETVYPNVLLEGVDVGGMTRTAVQLSLEQNGQEGYGGKSVTVSLPMDEELIVSAEQLGLGGTPESAAEAAWGYGRDGNVLQNTLRYLACLVGRGVNILWEGSGMDADALQSIAETAAADTNAKLESAEIEIGEENITLVKGAGTSYVEAEDLCVLVENAFALRDYNVIAYEPEERGYDIDFQALYDQIYVEAKNAEYDKETDSVTDHVTGVSFDIDAAEQKMERARVGQRVVITLDFTEPEITSDGLRECLFRDCLAEKVTSLSGSSSARINNVELSAASINDVVLLPGETFSYNQCLGERTTEKGYQEAGAYANGKHTTAVGGGICQASSMLYYCAIKSNLEITERWEHYFAVSYLPLGMDATVSWGGPDFCFANSRDYPIKIKSWVSDGQLYVQIWGTDVDGSYVDITSDGWEDANYYYAQTYRNVYTADGTLLSSEPEAYSSYNKHEAESESEED